ncbi:hypothetical protein AAMO2058_000593000 [Amorphochlora amoebiformis]
MAPPTNFPKHKFTFTDGFEHNPSIAKQEAVRRATITNILRIVMVTVAISALIYRSSFDFLLTNTWQWVRETRLLKWDTCEPFLAFIVFKSSFFLYDAFEAAYPNYYYWLIPEAKGTHIRHKRSVLYSIVYITPESLATFIYYYGPIVAFDLIFPRRVLPETIPGFWAIIGEITAMLVTYDFVFFWCHYMMHKHRGLYRLFHAKHHEAGVKYPLISWGTVALSFGQTWTNLFCSIFTVNSIKFLTLGSYQYHPISRIGYNCITVFWLVEEHSGYDMPWLLRNIVPFSLRTLAGGPHAHHAHHTRGHGNYQKWLTYLDSLMGTRLESFDDIYHKKRIQLAHQVNGH